MKHLLRIIAACLCFAAPCFAAPAPNSILPDKPEPQARIVADRDFWIEVGAVGTAWTVDTVSTHDLFATHANATEAGGLFNGSRSTPKVMVAWAGVDLGMGFAAYEWKNHIRNRYLHPLWRAFLAAQIAWHVQGATNNFGMMNAAPIRRSR